MKKISILLAILLLVSNPAIEVSASDSSQNNITTPGSVYLSAEEKMDFKNEKDKSFQLELLNGNTKQYDQKVVESLMLKASVGNIENMQELYAELESYGCYVINPNDNIENAVSTFSSSDSSDVAMTAPTIYYNAYNSTWTVTCGGYWKTTNWQKDFLAIGNVGGQDGFGVGYTNTSGTYKTAVLSCSAYITDGSTYVSTSNRSDGDGSKGFGFRLQDYVRGTMTSNYYVGYEWSGLCNYDSWFGNYSGVATSYYIHTYKSASISGVSFGVNGKNAGINANITNESNSFQCFSSDKKFGVQ